MVRIVVVVVCTKMEDGLCAKVAEGDVIGSTEGVLVDVHHKIGVVFPMLVASCAVGPVNAEVHRGLQDVPMHVVKDAGDGDVLLVWVDVGAGPSVVGVGFTCGFVGGPRDAHHVHVDVKSEFLVLWKAVAAIVVGKGVGSAEPLFFGGPQGEEGVAFHLQIGQYLGVEHHRDRACGVVVGAFVGATARGSGRGHDVHVTAHALNAGVVTALFPRDDVQ